MAAAPELVGAVAGVALGGLARPGEDDRLEPACHEVDEQVLGLDVAGLPAAAAPPLATLVLRGVPQQPVARPAGARVLVDERERRLGLAGDAGGVLDRVPDGRRATDPLRVGVEPFGHALEAAHDERDVAPEDAPVAVDLVDDYGL